MKQKNKEQVKKIKYNCYLCGKKIETNNLFATIMISIECEGDIIDTLLEEKICGWCANRFDYWKNKIQEMVKKEKNGK